ncbi:hypothetical protein DID88_005745 [Monilinia fructigena]|uniref:Uncharacterized protein n=1 Tax=Monilinia fructigena TaxID=38457 RepID=A0A395J1E0_9HELO|nr:hypothetical protein DID88_005745 [Monilinia fructigena]
MTSEELEVFSQQVGTISLAEAKDHLQNLGPVPTLLDFLKRRTSERKTNLATPALTTTAESVRTSFISSTTPPDSATPVEMTPPILRSTAAPIWSFLLTCRHPRLFLAPREQQDVTSRAQANERTIDNVMPSSTGSGAPAFLPRTSSMPRPLRSSGVLAAPVTTTSWVSDPYASNNGTPPASATARAMGVFCMAKSGSYLAHSSGCPFPKPDGKPGVVVRAPIRSPLASATGSRETTPDLVYSSDGSEEFEKRKTNGPASGSKPEHKKVRPGVLGTGHGVGDAGSAAPQNKGSLRISMADEEMCFYFGFFEILPSASAG